MAGCISLIKWIKWNLIWRRLPFSITVFHFAIESALLRRLWAILNFEFWFLISFSLHFTLLIAKIKVSNWAESKKPFCSLSKKDVNNFILLFFGQRALSLLRASRVIGCTAKFWLFWLVKNDVNVYRNMAFVMAWRSMPRIDFVIVSIKLWSCFLKLKSTFNPKPEIFTQITPSFFTRIFRGNHYQQHSTVTRRQEVSRLEGETDKYSSGTVTHQLERWKDERGLPEDFLRYIGHWCCCLALPCS